MKRNKDTFNLIIVLLVSVLVLFAGIFTKCHGQDSTAISNEKIIDIASELKELRFMDSINKIIISESDNIILHYQIKHIQDSLLDNSLQERVKSNINAIIPDKKKWYQKGIALFSYGFISSIAVTYSTALILKSLKK